MNTLTHPLKDFTVPVPSHWDEMRPSDIYYSIKKILEATLATGQEKLSPTDPTVKIFYRIANIQRDWRTLLWERVMPQEIVDDKNGNISLLANDLTSFMFTPSDKETPTPSNSTDPPEKNLELNYNTILNHFPVLHSCSTFRKLFHWEHRLYGPAHLLSDLTFSEFRAALEELDEYFEIHASDSPASEAHHQLSRFIACLYRPERKDYSRLVNSENFDGQRREPFNRYLMEKNARLIDHMNPVHRTIILLWFTGCVKYIQNKELIISGRKIKLRALFPRGTASDQRETKVDGGGWSSILYAVAKEGIFGNAEATDRTGLFDILIYLYDQHLENQRLKKKYGKSKPG